MKKSVKCLVYGAALMLLAGTSFAGTTGKEETGSLSKMQRSAQFCDAQSVIGKDVYNNQQQNLGDIKDIVFNAQKGETFAAIGVGHDEDALVPWQALKMTKSSTGKRELTLNTTKQALEAGPTVKDNQWHELNQRSFTENIYKRYNLEAPSGVGGVSPIAMGGSYSSSGKSK